MAVEHGIHHFKLKTMTRNQRECLCDTLPLHFNCKPMVNNLSGRGNGRRTRLCYSY